MRLKGSGREGRERLVFHLLAQMLAMIGAKVWLEPGTGDSRSPARVVRVQAYELSPLPPRKLQPQVKASRQTRTRPHGIQSGSSTCLFSEFFVRNFLAKVPWSSVELCVELHVQAGILGGVK